MRLLPPVRARRPPADDPHCGWLNLLPPPPPATRLEGSREADFAVLGAGFTGLAAARRLAELAPGARVALLEAQRVGFGASGRSSGFVVDLAGFVAAMPSEHGRRFVRLSRAGIELLRERVQGDGIACDWDDRGWLHAAAGEPGDRSLRDLRRWLDGLDEPYDYLDRDGLEGVLGTSFYRSAIRLPGSVLVQAAALARGLAAGLPPNVDLFEESPVEALESARPGFRLETPGGELRAGALAFATNGYSPGLGRLRRRIFPLLTFGSLSRPLTEAEQETLGGEREWGLLAQDPVGSSLRRTRDQRLLVRNTLAYARDGRASARQLCRARREHEKALLRRFPDLSDLGFEHTWAGVMGASPNLYPFFGPVAPRAAAAAGYTGAGISMGTVSGHLLAELLTGRDSDLLRDRQALPAPRRLPPEPFLGIGIRLKVLQMNRSGGETL